MSGIRALLTAAALLACASLASASIKTREVEYTHDGTTLQGYLAWDEDLPGRRPGILVVHEWWGHNQHTRRQAERLAAAGYVALAIDMFGKGKVTTHPQEAQAFIAEATKDGAAMMARFQAARAQLIADPHVDPDKIGAVGYCFGGSVVLGAARSGADLDAVVSIHGALSTDHPAGKGKVKARVLVLTGAADPLVPAAQVAALEREMKAAGARYRVVRYPGARHAFTNPDADKTGMEALGYDANADRKSFDEMVRFFRATWK